MEIKIKNDKKEKAQSYEAELSLSSGDSWMNYNVDLEGCGANEWSAKMNLIHAAEELVKKLQTLIDMHK